MWFAHPDSRINQLIGVDGVPAGFVAEHKPLEKDVLFHYSWAQQFPFDVWYDGSTYQVKVTRPYHLEQLGNSNFERNSLRHYIDNQFEVLVEVKSTDSWAIRPIEGLPCLSLELVHPETGLPLPDHPVLKKLVLWELDGAPVDDRLVEHLKKIISDIPAVDVVHSSNSSIELLLENGRVFRLTRSETTAIIAESFMNMTDPHPLVPHIDGVFRLETPRGQRDLYIVVRENASDIDHLTAKDKKQIKSFQDWADENIGVLDDFPQSWGRRPDGSLVYRQLTAPTDDYDHIALRHGRSSAPTFSHYNH